MTRRVLICYVTSGAGVYDTERVDNIMLYKSTLKYRYNQLYNMIGYDLPLVAISDGLELSPRITSETLDCKFRPFLLVKKEVLDEQLVNRDAMS